MFGDFFDFFSCHAHLLQAPGPIVHLESSGHIKAESRFTEAQICIRMGPAMIASEDEYNLLSREIDQENHRRMFETQPTKSDQGHVNS
jgi:hypothetical protein